MQCDGPHSVNLLTEDYRKSYMQKVIDKFLDEFVFLENEFKVSDGICSYEVNLIKCFLLPADFKDAVSTGNGEHLLILISSQHMDLNNCN